MHLDHSAFLHTLCADYRIHNSLKVEARTNSHILRGLRYDDGTGVKKINAVVIGMGQHGTEMTKALTWACQSGWTCF